MILVNPTRTPWEKLLSSLFPVTLPGHMEEPRHEHLTLLSLDVFSKPVVEDGILWRAYDVKRTGIEKYHASQDR